MWRFGDNVDTDQIIPARYLNILDLKEMATHCFEGAHDTFAREVAPGDVIIAGWNFGCGSSREEAPLVLKSLGVGVIIAKSFARIFFRNAINIGLPVLECPLGLDEIGEGDKVVVDLEEGALSVPLRGLKYQGNPFPEFLKAIARCGGLKEHVRNKLSKSQDQIHEPTR